MSATVQQTDRIVIRECKELAEFQACVNLQKAVWNYEDMDVVPLRMFIVSHKIGGQTVGAFDDGQLVGFAFSVPGMRAGHSYLHSHMLAVNAEWRNYGLGRRLKLAQREDAVRRGIDLLEWTFDPLEIKNAHLNIARLGAIVRRYSVNHYGHSSSPLQGGLPTDRLVAEWWVSSDRVKGLLDQNAPAHFAAERSITVPADIYSWKASDTDRHKAADVQKRNREEFLRAFSQGLAVLGFQRDQQGNGTFQLGRWDETWSYASTE